MRKINYDKVAERYDDDWSGLYTTARKHAIEQISQQHAISRRAVDTIDLGIGTGNTLVDLRDRIRLGQCTGLDLSQGMLDRAARKLDGSVRLIRDDALRAPAHVEVRSQDLVLCHFILSFFDVDRLLVTAFELLRPGGYLSVATSTRSSMSEIHQGRFKRVSRLLGIGRSLEKSSNPADHGDCLNKIAAAGFEIVSACAHRQPICYRSFRDVEAWGVDSGWLVNTHDARLGLRIAGGRLLFAMAQALMLPPYPIHATSEISIVLARKPLSETRDEIAVTPEVQRLRGSAVETAWPGLGGRFSPSGHAAAPPGAGAGGSRGTAHRYRARRR